MISLRPDAAATNYIEPRRRVKRAKELSGAGSQEKRSRDDGSVSGIGLFSGYDPGSKRHPGTRTFCSHGDSLIRRRSVFVLTNGGVRSDSSKRDRMARQIWALPSMISDLSNNRGGRI
jgi:hypothetical protein